MSEISNYRNNVSELMTAQGITLARMATRTGLAASAVLNSTSPGEDHEKEVYPSFRTIEKIAVALNVPMSRLFEPSAPALPITAPSEVSPTQEPILQFFGYGHLPMKLREVVRPFTVLAQRIVNTVPRNSERTVALRKLLESKQSAIDAYTYKTFDSPTVPK